MQKPLISAPAEMGGFVLVGAPAPSPGEHKMFWVTQPFGLRRHDFFKIPNDGFSTSPKISAKIRNCQDKSTLSGGAFTDGVLFYKIIFEHNF